jgi:hypothetical protein
MMRLLFSICLVLALTGLYSHQSDYRRDITPTAERASASAIPAASPTPNEAVQGSLRLITASLSVHLIITFHSSSTPGLYALTGI